MINDLPVTLAALSVFTFGQVMPTPTVPDHILATHQISLENRYGNKWVNDIFKENILLTLSRFNYEFKLQPNETFAFHDDVLPKYQGRVVKTTNSHFNGAEGFKSDGYLSGDGVCHLASLLYWVAKDAALDTEAPTNHNFADIPEVPKESGVSIYATNQKQNLYITNNRPKAVTFKFEYENNAIKVSAVEVN